MKIKKDDNIYIFPLESKINILVENKFKDDVISCFIEYFDKGKKNYCQVFDDYGQIISQKEFAFIYIPSSFGISGSLDFKDKSIGNMHVSKLMEENQDMFTSVERIRDELYELLTDAGMYRVRKILGVGLDTSVEISVDDFNVSKILQFLKIKHENLTEVEKFIVLYNLLIFVNRKVNTLVYLDFPIDEKIIKWINSIDSENVMFLLNNNIALNAIHDIDSCVLISFSNKNYMETIDYDLSEFCEISYAFNPIVKEYIQFQNKKIVEFYNQFYDVETTFYLKFKELNIQNSFI